jgi:hypothetical protein
LGASSHLLREIDRISRYRRIIWFTEDITIIMAIK